MSKIILPAGYTPALNLYDTQRAIGTVKRLFADTLCATLNLRRVSAPLFVEAASGLNDDLNGVERKVAFDIRDTGVTAEVVQSLAKWKRKALKDYDFHVGKGLYCDMNAIRRDEELDELHSVYVDQWDWEKVIAREDRTPAFLEATVRTIYAVMRQTAQGICDAFPALENYFPEKISFVTTQELEDAYPGLTPKAREREAVRKYGAVFLKNIGGKLRSGSKHDGRAPDYDDWNLNGDILVYYPPLDCAFELSSMGIRVDETSLIAQLEAEGCTDRLRLPFHRTLAAGELPLTMGGGIGQSRLCMIMLNKVHIGEVQVSVWDEKTHTLCKNENIPLM